MAMPIEHAPGSPPQLPGAEGPHKEQNWPEAGSSGTSVQLCKPAAAAGLYPDAGNPCVSHHWHLQCFMQTGPCRSIELSSAAFMSAHSKTPYITHGMDISSGGGVVRGRRMQQLEFTLMRDWFAASCAGAFLNLTVLVYALQSTTTVDLVHSRVNTPCG